MPSGISLSSSASRIGAGNWNTSRQKLICRVLMMERTAAGVEKMRSKCAKPTHWLPQIPSLAEYFLKASTRPYIG